MSRAKNKPLPMSLLYKWRKAIASEHGPPSTTRLVLLALSLHMSQEGDSCFPSMQTLAIETGLTERCVCTHIQNAVNDGWLKSMKRGLKGQAWKRNEYRAEMPKKVLNVVQYQGTEGRSVPSDKGTEPRSKGTEPDDKKALNDVQSRCSFNSTKSVEDPPNQNRFGESSTDGYSPTREEFEEIRNTIRGMGG